MQLSVIIPTYHRASALDACLTALAPQVLDAEWEVVIVDDGSKDETEAVVARHSESFPVAVKYQQQANAGPARARNVGIEASSGEIILFIGDDIIASDTDYLSEHLKWHTERFRDPRFAVLGLTTWNESVPITAFMRWLENGGPQFAYGDLTCGGVTDARHFYTSNVSLKRAFLGADRFDERFRWAAWEDVELGHRLEQRGLAIAYNSAARATHLHKISLAGYLKRARVAGRSAALVGQIHADLVERSPGTFAASRQPLLKRTLINSVTYPLLLFAGRLVEDRIELGALYTSLYLYQHRRGLREGWAQPIST